MRTIDSNKGTAYAGFENFATAQNYANEIGGEVALFTRKYGAATWTYVKEAFEPLDMRLFVDEVNSDGVYCSGAEYISSMKNLMGDDDAYADIEEAVESVARKIDGSVSAGQFAVVYDNRYVKVFDDYSMEVHDDGECTSYLIAVCN